MPQSLSISTPPQVGSSAKRLRSVDSRDPQPRPVLAGQNGSRNSSHRLSRAHLRPDIKVPPYLQKSKTGRSVRSTKDIANVNAEISATFQEIEWKQRFRLFHAMENPETSPYKVDRSDIVINRNRYGNVQPWDASRIKLQIPIGGSDYVNASPIVLKSKSPKASEEESGGSSTVTMKYIASQGPKQGQESHFWHMVHQETVGDTAVVIMLTQLVESNKEKCAQYFPAELDNPMMTLLHEESDNVAGDDGRDPFLDNYEISGADEIKALKNDDETDDAPAAEPEPSSTDTITLLSKEFDSSVGCEVRKLRLVINEIPKMVIHYLFNRWPDFGKPDTDDRKALIELSRRSLLEAGDSPRIVHCSAGVGRTGTWIALDFLVREVEEDRLLDSVKPPTSDTMDIAVGANSETSKSETWGKSGPPKINTPTREDGFDKDEHDLIFETVNTLREQRMMMVMSEMQFSFLYDVVKEAVIEKYRARPEGAVVMDGVDPETLPRLSKMLKTEDGVDDESVSEAETEIMDIDTQQKVPSDDEDPYKAVSPDVVRRRMTQDF
ncbi:tyrosine protein phosphatase 1 [Neophaeococcomyces mojaviensis]|uniref:Tyrosine protein phosphatase 1 n=1 Tax=Neophaeococcomyces mojaviensis TaxID=3383035 RepID=A0ACC3A3N6_9EURO|nr:tyrosine protein phosphatase 1 [Knufia sp. JES_112]